MSANPNWARWVFASVATFLKQVAQSQQLAVLVEGLDDRTTEVMERSVASGYHGFGILPTKAMGVPFMRREFLTQYKHAVDTAARLGLKMCLYDEFWFPSGSAGGLLGQRYPEALSKRLDMVETNVAGPGTGA